MNSISGSLAVSMLLGVAASSVAVLEVIGGGFYVLPLLVFIGGASILLISGATAFFADRMATPDDWQLA